MNEKKKIKDMVGEKMNEKKKRKEKKKWMKKRKKMNEKKEKKRFILKFQNFKFFIKKYSNSEF